MFNSKIVLAVCIGFCVAVFSFIVIAEQLDNTSTNTTQSNVTISQTNAQSNILETVISLVSNKESFVRGEIVHLIVSMTEGDNAPGADLGIIFYVNNEKIGEGRTDYQGQVQLDWNTTNATTGVCPIVANFVGTEQNGTSLKPSVGINIITLTENKESVPENNSIKIERKQEIVAPVAEVKQETDLSKPIIEQLGIVGKKVSDNVEKYQDCQQTILHEAEGTETTCVTPYNVTVCDDTNSSCTKRTDEYTHPCLVDVRIVDRTIEDCRDKWLIINKKLKVDVDWYNCSVEESGGTITIICDSIYDGNGDGICTSGESCQKFVVQNETASRFEKNSKDFWQETDPGFTSRRTHVEVLQ